MSAADQSFQSLVIFFFLKRTQTETLLSAINRLTSHISSSSDNDDDDDDAGSESMFDMECQHMGTHVPGYPAATEQLSQADKTSEHSSPVFGRCSTAQTNEQRSSPVFGRRSTAQASEQRSSPVLGRRGTAQASEERSSPVLGRRGTAQASERRPSPVFGRRSIHDVKPTAGLQALHEYDGCDQSDEPEDPLQSSDEQIEEIVVPIGFNSTVIKYVNHMLSC